MNNYVKQIKEGLIDENPTFVQFLGMCPTLAVTTSVSNAVGMGLSVTAVLICSNLLISLLRKFIPKEIRIASYIVIISGFVTAVELLLHAYVDPLYASLGLYIPLIVVNCIILARAEAFASKNPPLPSIVDGLAMGLGFTCSLAVIGSVREILGAGTWLGMPIPGLHAKPAAIFILPAGAFLTLGFLAALVNAIRRYAAEHPRKAGPVPADADVPAEDTAPAAEEIIPEAPAAETPETGKTAPEAPAGTAVQTPEPTDEGPAETVSGEIPSLEVLSAEEPIRDAEETPAEASPEEDDDASIPDITIEVPEEKEQKNPEDLVFSIVLPDALPGTGNSDEKEGE